MIFRFVNARFSILTIRVFFSWKFLKKTNSTFIFNCDTNQAYMWTSATSLAFSSSVAVCPLLADEKELRCDVSRTWPVGGPVVSSAATKFSTSGWLLMCIKVVVVSILTSFLSAGGYCWTIFNVGNDEHCRLRFLIVLILNCESKSLLLWLLKARWSCFGPLSIRLSSFWSFLHRNAKAQGDKDG